MKKQKDRKAKKSEEGTFRERQESIESQRQRLALAEEALWCSREEALRLLPESFGFGSLAEFIKALRDSSVPARGRRVKRRGRPPVGRAGGAKHLPAPIQLVPVVSAGSDLGVPREFRLLPDPACLQKSAGEGADEYRQRLAAELRSTERVLHTSGVVAEVWRAWRSHERTLREAISAAR